MRRLAIGTTTLAFAVLLAAALATGCLFDGDDDRVMIDRNESDAFRWVSLDELAAIPDFRDLAPRIETLLGEADAK